MRAAGSASDLLDDREFAVPRELVFEAWTVPEHFARWFGPDGVEVPVCEIDARPGGEIRFHHRFPTGELVSIKGVFDEVVAPARLRFTFTFVDAEDRPTAPPQLLDWPVGVHIVLTFVNPIILGGGNPWLPPDVRMVLELVDEHRLGGVVHLHYRAN